jgi:hypothetical protein
MVKHGFGSKFKSLTPERLAQMQVWLAGLLKAREKARERKAPLATDPPMPPPNEDHANSADVAHTGENEAVTMPNPSQDDVIPEPGVDLEGVVTEAAMQQLQGRGKAFQTEGLFVQLAQKYPKMDAKMWKDAWVILAKSKMITPGKVA